AHVHRHLSFCRELAPRLRARQPKLSDGGHRLHRRPASIGLPGRAAGPGVRRALSGAYAASRNRLNPPASNAAVAPADSDGGPPDKLESFDELAENGRGRLHRRVGVAVWLASARMPDRGARTNLPAVFA